MSGQNGCRLDTWSDRLLCDLNSCRTRLIVRRFPLHVSGDHNPFQSSAPAFSQSCERNLEEQRYRRNGTNQILEELLL
jgi:hypothetical protein